METFGMFLKRMRANKYTQRELASLLGVGYPYISKLEADIEKNPSERLLLDFAHLFELKPSEVFLKANKIPENWVKEITASPELFGKLEKIVTSSKKEKIENDLLFQKYFDNSLKSMILINPESAEIIDANNAAIDFYGYSKYNLLNKTVFDLNVLSEGEIRNNIENVCNKVKNTFEFTHKLSDGRTKDIFVMSELVSFKESSNLLSIIVEKK